MFPFGWASVLCFVEVLAPNYDGEDIPLGRGHYAEAAFKVAVALAATNLPKLLDTGRLLLRGNHFKTDGKGHPINVIVGLLMQVHPNTVAAHLAQFKATVGESVGARGVQGHMAAAAKHGPKKKDARAASPLLFDVLREKVNHARTHGYTLTIDKLLLHVRESNDLPGIELSHPQLRYYLLRMGFHYARIQPTIKSGRSRGDVVQWLISYSQRRVDFADTPDVAVVHMYCDETFLYRDETGQYSWYLDEKRWEMGQLPHDRWGISQALFSWWEREDAPPQPAVPEGRGLGPYGRGRGRGRGAGGAVQYVRRYAHFSTTLGVWSCKKDGNMNSVRFIAWLRTVFAFVQARFPDRSCVVHMDNARYHKKKNEPLNFASATPWDIILHLMQTADPALGLNDLALYLKDNGDPKPKKHLKEMAKSFLPPAPRYIDELCAEFGYRVTYTPPYWPEVMPQELWNHNLKLDYRQWDTDQRGPNVGAAVRAFAAAVPDQDAQSWIAKTDRFCRAVVERDAAVLCPLVLDVLT
jgi:hypothetical protein